MQPRFFRSDLARDEVDGKLDRDELMPLPAALLAIGLDALLRGLEALLGLKLGKV